MAYNNRLKPAKNLFKKLITKPFITAKLKYRVLIDVLILIVRSLSITEWYMNDAHSSCAPDSTLNFCRDLCCDLPCLGFFSLDFLFGTLFVIAPISFIEINNAK